MRIVIAALSAPTGLNGVSRHAANLARGLLSLPDPPEIHFLAGAWQSSMFARAIGSMHAQLRIHSMDIPHRTFARLRWYYRELPRIARRLEADLVHFTYTMPLDAPAFCCPTVVSLHDLYPFDIPQNFGWLKGRINRELMRQCMRGVDAISCVSESTRARLRQRFGETLGRKAVTILNAVEPVAESAAQRPGNVTGDDPFLLCIAQHRQNKNIPLVLSIFERLLRKHVVAENTRLLIIGIPGPDTGLIRTRIRRQCLERNVTLLSGISDAELQWCYRNCQVLLAPSSIEGFGLPVVEALLAGCPVVCSDIPAFREIGGDRCRYVPFGANVEDRYERAIGETIAEGRAEPITLPGLLPAALAEDYMALYRRLLAPAPQSHCPSYADPAAEEFDSVDAG